MLYGGFDIRRDRRLVQLRCLLKSFLEQPRTLRGAPRFEFDLGQFDQLRDRLRHIGCVFATV